MTGTDTGVGKTTVAAGLLGALRRKGLRVGAFKPVESGHDAGKDGWPPDARALAAAAGLLDRPRGDVVPYVLREPLAPAVGAEREGVTIDLAVLDERWARMRDGHELSIVEGAGGIAVPLDRQRTMADLAARWSLPVLVVARPGLGTINHTVLTVEHARRRGLAVLGIVVCGFPAVPNTAEETAPAVIERMAGAPVLGLVPRSADIDVDAGRTEAAARLVEDAVDLSPFLALAGRG